MTETTLSDSEAGRAARPSDVTVTGLSPLAAVGETAAEMAALSLRARRFRYGDNDPLVVQLMEVPSPGTPEGTTIAVVTKLVTLGPTGIAELITQAAQQDDDQLVTQILRHIPSGESATLPGEGGELLRSVGAAIANRINTGRPEGRTVAMLLSSPDDRRLLEGLVVVEAVIENIGSVPGRSLQVQELAKATANRFTNATGSEGDRFLLHTAAVERVYDTHSHLDPKYGKHVDTSKLADFELRLASARLLFVLPPERAAVKCCESLTATVDASVNAITLQRLAEISESWGDAPPPAVLKLATRFAEKLGAKGTAALNAFNILRALGPQGEVGVAHAATECTNVEIRFPAVLLVGKPTTFDLNAAYQYAGAKLGKFEVGEEPAHLGDAIKILALHDNETFRLKEILKAWRHQRHAVMYLHDTVADLPGCSHVRIGVILNCMTVGVDSMFHRGLPYLRRPENVALVKANLEGRFIEKGIVDDLTPAFVLRVACYLGKTGVGTAYSIALKHGARDLDLRHKAMIHVVKHPGVLEVSETIVLARWALNRGTYQTRMNGLELLQPIAAQAGDLRDIVAKIAEADDVPTARTAAKELLRQIPKPPRRRFGWW